MLKRVAVEFGVWAVLTAIYRWLLWLAAGLASNAAMGWGDDQIAAWLGITAPSFLQVVSFITSWGPPLILAALTMWAYHWLHSRRTRPVARGDGSQHDGATPLDKQAEDVARRIDVLGSKYPVTMPDHPEYPRIGVGRNEEANDAYMREYRETMATDVQRVFAEAIGRGLMDDLDQVYSRETVVARRGVEEIGRILVRIGRNVRVGNRAPLPTAFKPKPDYPDTPLAQFVERRLQLNHPTDSDAAEDYFIGVGSLFTEIRDKAVLGQITVWGRENCPVGQKHTPPTPIPAEHWKIAQIDIVDYLSDPERQVGCTQPLKSAFNRTYFSDLFLNARQINEAWE